MGEGSPPDRFRTVVALLIVIVSLAGAGVAFSASIASNRAGDLDQAALQEYALKNQILGIRRQQVAEDARLASVYQDHEMAARLLQQQADRVRARHPTIAGALDEQAQAEAAQARTTGSHFVANFPQVLPDGRVVYDQQQALQNLLAQDIDYQGLDPAATAREAADAHAKAVRVVAVGIVFVAALFFLTLAQIGRAGSRMALAVVGTLALVAGAAMWIAAGL
jgi:hypothetical protein